MGEAFVRKHLGSDGRKGHEIKQGRISRKQSNDPELGSNSSQRVASVLEVNSGTHCCERVRARTETEEPGRKRA